MRGPAITVENPVIKTTTVREIVPPGTVNGITGKSPRPDYWEFVRAIDDAQVGVYMIYFYRDDPGRIQIDHTTGKHWDTPHGLIWIGDQEGLEAVTARECGGGAYRLVIKRRQNSEWIAEAKFRIDLAPRPVNPWYFRRPAPGQPEQPNGTANPNGNRSYLSNDPTAQVANKAMDVLAGQEHAAVNIGIELFKAAGDVLKNRGNSGGGLEDEVMRSLLARALNPPAPPAPPDPIELLTRVLNLQAQLNPGGAGGANPIVQKIMDVAFTRLLEPVNTAPAVSAGAEIVRTLPSIFAHGVEIAREWRLGMEAQRDGVMVMQQPPAPARPPQPPPIPPPQVLAPSAAPRPNPNPSVNSAPPGIVPPSTEFIETRIVEIFRAPISAEEAAERTLEFLYTLSGENATPETSYVELLGKQGETNLWNLFQARPILQPAMANTGRLRDFIRAFLKLYQEDKKEEEQLAAVKPN